MRNLCVIPAKLASSRLPFKNIKLFFGKPVIYYSIKTALKSKIFSKVFVSTDSPKIANISKKYGAESNFLRPKRLSGKNTPIIDVIRYVIRRFKKKIFFDFVCCLFPVAPLVTKKLLRISYQKILKSNSKFIFPATYDNTSNQHYFYLNKNNKIKKIFKKKPLKNLKKIYSDAGQFYWGSSENWLKKDSKIIKENFSEVILIKKISGIDVNDKSDWYQLKKLFRNKYV